jgi:hypothetical protein
MHRCLYSCLVAMQHANCIFPAQRYIVVCGLSGCALFFHISHKYHDFIEQKICVLFPPQILCETFLILRGLHRYYVINVGRSS